MRERIVFRLSKRPSTKPPSPGQKVVRVINSPAFLWVATAILVTIGGASITQMQQCSADAAKLSERFEKLADEIEYRGRRLDEELRRNSSVEEFGEKLKVAPNRYAEFATHNLAELFADINRISRKASVENRSPVSSILLARAEYEAVVQDDRSLPFRQVFQGEIPINSIAAEDFSGLKAWRSEIVKRSPFAVLAYVQRGIPYIESDCSVSNVSRRIFGREAKIIRIEAFGSWYYE